MIQAVKLIKSVTTNTHVLRSRSLGSEEVEIDQRHVVPGDIIAVTSRLLPFTSHHVGLTLRSVIGGDVFPGDCVLIVAEAITITQASLTGEMMPIDKTVRLAAARPGEKLDLLHNDNVCLAGTSVVTGNGHAVVVSTGKNTYMASIASELSKRRPENATQIGIKKVSYVLMGFMGVSRCFVGFSCVLRISPFLDRLWLQLCSSFRVPLARTGKARSCSQSPLLSELLRKCCQ